MIVCACKATMHGLAVHVLCKEGTPPRRYIAADSKSVSGYIQLF